MSQENEQVTEPQPPLERGQAILQNLKPTELTREETDKIFRSWDRAERPADA